MPKKSNGKVHITQKPLPFVQNLVTNSSVEGDIVLDPFMGSGTTGVASIHTERRFVGIEKNESYYNIAVERIKMRKRTLF